MTKPQTPLLTVDIIIELRDRPDHPIVMIRRRNPPHGWAFPGGFVDVGESVDQAAVREAGEETGLDVVLNNLLGCYSDPARDPRGHTASVVYIASASGSPVAADDAADILVCEPGSPPEPLVFDHGRILSDYVSYRNRGKLPAPDSTGGRGSGRKSRG
jgi:8-oxo-dGTP diphosphatase